MIRLRRASRPDPADASSPSQPVRSGSRQRLAGVAQTDRTSPSSDSVEDILEEGDPATVERQGSGRHGGWLRRRGRAADDASPVMTGSNFPAAGARVIPVLAAVALACGAAAFVELRVSGGPARAVTKQVAAGQPADSVSASSLAADAGLRLVQAWGRSTSSSTSLDAFGVDLPAAPTKALNLTALRVAQVSPYDATSDPEGASASLSPRPSSMPFSAAVPSSGPAAPTSTSLTDRAADSRTSSQTPVPTSRFRVLVGALAGGKSAYFAVPVQVVGQQATVLSLPSPAPEPTVTAEVDPDYPTRDVSVRSPVTSAVTGFLGAYLKGEDVSRYASPGVQLTPVTGALMPLERLLRVDATAGRDLAESTTPPDGARTTVQVTFTTRSPGGSVASQISLLLQARATRWEVLQVDPGPAAAPEQSSTAAPTTLPPSAGNPTAPGATAPVIPSSTP